MGGGGPSGIYLEDEEGPARQNAIPCEHPFGGRSVYTLRGARRVTSNTRAGWWGGFFAPPVFI